MEQSNSAKSEPGFGALKSLDSAPSQIEPEQARFTLPPEHLPSQMSFTFTAPFGDLVSAMIICTQHKKVALCPLDQKGLWFPSCAIKQGDSYSKSITTLLNRLLLAETSNIRFKTPQLVQQLRLQTSQNLNFINRLIFFTELVTPFASSSDYSSSGECCSNNSLLTWYPFCEVENLPNLCGNEPITFIERLDHDQNFLCVELVEKTIEEVTHLYDRVATHQEMLRKCDCDEKCLQLLYSEFSQHCFPSENMNRHSFFRYVAMSGLTFTSASQDLNSVFRAFTNEQTNYIDLYKFCLGLTALDPETAHGGPSGLERISYIFWYYQKTSLDLTLSFDIWWFARDLILLKTGDCDQETLESTVHSLYSTFGLSDNSNVPFKSFKTAVGSLQVRGTHGMFRASHSPISIIKSKPVYNSGMNQSNQTCARCQKHFTVARHSVRMKRNGTIVQPNVHRQKHIESLINEDKVTRQRSNQMFSKNLFSELMDEIRSFNKNPRNSNWTKNRNRWAKKILSLCKAAKELFAKEARVLKLNSPIYVLGDIHGNLHDLMIFETMLWQSGPACLTANYLFLGDYVDRGDYSVECITYLLCAKMLIPERFHLLRGNHELREIQKNFTFYTECIDKFGSNQGLLVWEQFNQTFDFMPVCAVIDSNIFCAHGGIPTSMVKLGQVESCLPCPMPDPERQCPVAWQILWNDPVGKREYESTMAILKKTKSAIKLPPGFTHNTKRGTGYYFAEPAVDVFLSANGLSHIIRAHEVFPTGFNFHANGRVVTVFSCSNYSGQLNDAVVILVGPDCKIRPITMDTK